VYLKTTEKTSNANSSKDLVQKGELQGNQQSVAAVGNLHHTPMGAYLTHKDHTAVVKEKDAEIKALEKENRKLELEVEKNKMRNEHQKAIGKIETNKGIDWAAIIPVAINALGGNAPTAQVGVAGLEGSVPHEVKPRKTKPAQNDPYDYGNGQDNDDSDEEEDYDVDAVLDYIDEIRTALPNEDIVEIVRKLTKFVVGDPITAKFMLAKL
jgi:hypothetical protein